MGLRNLSGTVLGIKSLCSLKNDKGNPASNLSYKWLPVQEDHQLLQQFTVALMKKKMG